MNLSELNMLIELETFDKGGLQKVVLDSALLSKEHGVNITVISIGHIGFLAEKAKKAGIAVFSLENANKAKEFQHILQKQQINLSCSHFSDFGYRFYNEFRIPNITFIHNVYAFLCGASLRNFLDSDRYVDQYIAVSKNAARYASEKMGVQKDKIITIGNGLIIAEHEEKDRNRKAVSRESLGLRKEDYVFLNVASYNLHKGHYVMADAMKKILAQRKDVKIVCIGNVIYPPHAAEFQEYIKTHKLDRHILMPGFHGEVTDFYKMADAFLMPSFIEGWSIAMTEAMFYEKPMILTDTGASAEVIKKSDIGILIENEYGDLTNLDAVILDEMAYNQRRFRISQPLADAMMNFADNRDYWKEAGKKGRTKVLENHCFDKTVEAYEALFLKVVKIPKQRLPENKIRRIKDIVKKIPARIKKRLQTKFKQGMKHLIKGRIADAPKIMLPSWLKTFIKLFLPRRIPGRVKFRRVKALIFYLANTFFMNFPSYTLRHFFLRRFCRIKIGKDSSILHYCYVSGPHIQIGDNTVINRHVYLDGRAQLTIGNNVSISHYVLIHTLTHDPQNPNLVCLVKPVVIKDNVWIGARAIILPGVILGEGAVIGAGAVVTKDIPAYTIAVGNPARVIKERSRDVRYRCRYFPLLNTDIP